MSGNYEKDAKYGWYRYDVRFALPVYDDKSGEICRHNIFFARMLVRHDADGRKYLYACGSDSSGLFSCRFWGEVVLVANRIKGITVEIGGNTELTKKNERYCVPICAQEKITDSLK